jgi:hypothetical protein
MWYEKFGFKDDPYVIRSPMVVPFEQIRWNRNDLADKPSLDSFIERVLNGRRVGMRIWGSDGSGKTWLLRWMEKTLTEKSKGKALVIYTYSYIPRLEPTFSVFYEKFISEIDSYLPSILKAIDAKVDHKRANWPPYLRDTDLASALSHIHDEENVDDYKRWLSGARMPATELRDLGLSRPLERDYRKYEIMKTLIMQSLLAYSSFTLIVDELENAPPTLAKGLGDSLRDLLDSFYDKFSLVCSYTAEIADDIIDWGYGKWLYGRLEHEVKMDTFRDPDALMEFLRIHHECYRKARYKVEDQLFPFEEGGVRRLMELVEPKICYARSMLINCGALAEQAAQQNEKISDSFVDENKELLPHLAP